METFRAGLQLMEFLPVIAMLCLLPASVLCGRCQLEAQETKPLIMCNFSQSAISSLRNTNFSTDCQFLDLSQNRLQTVGDFVFSQQANLTYLDLSFNQITTLNPRTFNGLHQLVCLDLRQNQLNFTYEAYPQAVFVPLKRLKILDIRNNFNPTTQTTSPDISFQVLNSLEELFLDLFGDVKLGAGFASLNNLRLLTASVWSYIEIVSANYFISFGNLNITTLILAECGLWKIDPNAFEFFGHLTHLSLANNHNLGLSAAVNSLIGLSKSPLSSIDFRHVNSGLSHIEDQFITKDTGKLLSPFCLRSLDLSDNMIVHVDTTIFNMLRSECLEVLQLSHMYLLGTPLQGILLMLFRFQNLRVINAANSMIPEPISRQSKTYLTEDPLRIRRYVLTISLPPKLEIYNMRHTTYFCPTTGLEIVINCGLSLRIFDISYSSGQHCFHKRWRGIENLRSLLISGNEYGETLNSVFFSSFPNLTRLVMRDVFLTPRFQADKALLNPLQQLQELDMANSGLTSLSRDSLSGLLHLKRLDLSLNRFIAVPDLTYISPTLQVLDMKYNALVSIPLTDRKKVDYFAIHSTVLALSLNGNPLVCNCETYDFVEWIWTSKVAFDMHGNYSCIASNGSVVPLLTLRENFRDLQVTCISSFWVTFGALAVSIIFISLLVSAVVYRYRVPIKYWYHTLCRKPEARPSRRHKYDALVAYCHHDYQWVCRTLYPKLTHSENGNSYRLCVYDRDFLPGVPIEENIITAINDSFKIILVITPAFVQSAWCQFELQMARMRMIQVGREDVVIPIILHDVPVSSMPRSLLNLWNTSVFLVWSESPGEQRHFWENLVAALGPVSVGGNLEDDHNDRNIEEQEVVEQENEHTCIMALNPGDDELLLLRNHRDDELILES